MIVKHFHSHKAERDFIFAANADDHDEDKLLALKLQKKLRPHLHRDVLGFPKGRGLNLMHLRTIEERMKGKHIERVDVRKAYRSVDPRRLDARLRRRGIETYCGEQYILRSGKKIVPRGLPEGRPPSPPMLAFHMSAVMKRFTEKYSAALYCDDLFIFLDSPEEADAAVDFFQTCLDRNGYHKRRMTIHRDGTKKPKLTLNNQLFQFAGLMISEDQEILPDNAYSATSFIHILRNLRKLCQSKPTTNETKRILDQINNLMPCNWLEWGTDEKGRLNTSLSSYTTPPGDSSPTGGMARKRLGRGDFASYEASSFFNPKQRKARALVFEILNEDFSRLQQLYERQKITPYPHYHENRLGEIMPIRHPFWDFVEELGAKFIAFNRCNSFTYEFSNKYQPIDKRERSLGMRLYLTELRLISGWKKNVANPLVLDLRKIGIRPAKLKQFLRGYATYRFLTFAYPDFPRDVSPAIVKALGTLVFPQNRSVRLCKMVKSWKEQEITTGEFELLIKKLGATMKEESFNTP